MSESQQTVSLPPPALQGSMSLEQALAQRRSVREYRDGEITLAELGQLLWAAQGVTNKQGFRTAPSAGALYPLELYVAASSIAGLHAGLYHFQPQKHQLTLVHQKAVANVLAQAALGQSWVRDAAAVVVFTGIYERTTKKYGKRGERYVHIETGHAAQNVFLQAQSLGLGTVAVGAFDDDAVADVLHLPSEQRPLLLMPVGRM